MKRTMHFFLSLLACPLLLPVVRAEELPPKLAGALRTRDQKLSQLTFDWKVSTTQTHLGLNSKGITTASENIARNARKEARRGGVTDAKILASAADTSVRNILPLLKGYESHFSTTWRFTRDGDAMLIAGDTERPPSPPNQVQAYYGHGIGFMVVNRADIKDVPSYVWGCSGNCTQTLDKPDNDLSLTPETFAMQTGTNPLAMYNAHWKLIATTPQSWVLEAQVNHNDRVNDTVQMKLSRQYGGVPVEIHIKGDRWTAQYQATRFARQGNTWVCTEAQYFEDRWGIFTYRQKWQLKNIAASKHISIASLKVAPRATIFDYRLGNSLGYRWSGALPSLTELKKRRDIERPGELTPDPNKSSPAPAQPISTSSGVTTPVSRSSVVGSVLPFAGGVLCIAGGVWMFKQRHTR